MARPDPELLAASRYPYAIRATTRFADVDPNRHINNVAMSAILEDARSRYGQMTGMHNLTDYRVMIVSNYIDYTGEAQYPDPIDVHVGTLSVGRSSWTLAVLATQYGMPCAFARSVLVTTRDGRAAPLPEPFRAELLARLIRQ